MGKRIPFELHNLLSRCWHHKPESRPTSKEALEEMNLILRQLHIPPRKTTELSRSSNMNFLPVLNESRSCCSHPVRNLSLGGKPNVKNLYTLNNSLSIRSSEQGGKNLKTPRILLVLA